MKYVGLAAPARGSYDFVVIALPLSALPPSALLILAFWLSRMHLVRDLHRKTGDLHPKTGDLHPKTGDLHPKTGDFHDSGDWVLGIIAGGIQPYATDEGRVGF